MKTVEISQEVFDAVWAFLNRVGDGYVELSHDKVAGEYRYYKRKAYELKWDFKPFEKEA